MKMMIASATLNTVSEETLVKVMGVPWDRIEDNFKFDLTTFSGQALEGTLTKQKLLSITARFYVPLGLVGRKPYRKISPRVGRNYWKTLRESQVLQFPVAIWMG